MPVDLGEMLNSDLGDCTCAAFFHARQVWTFNAGGAEITEPDADVLELSYSEACGYVQGDDSTDQGGNEQAVLTYCLKPALRLAKTAGTRFSRFSKLITVTSMT